MTRLALITVLLATPAAAQVMVPPLILEEKRAPFICVEDDGAAWCEVEPMLATLMTCELRDEDGIVLASATARGADGQAIFEDMDLNAIDRLDCAPAS